MSCPETLLLLLLSIHWLLMVLLVREVSLLSIWKRPPWVRMAVGMPQTKLAKDAMWSDPWGPAQLREIPSCTPDPLLLSLARSQRKSPESPAQPPPSSTISTPGAGLSAFRPEGGVCR